MKKFIYFLAIAGVALAGCTKNEPVKVDEGLSDTPIAFSAITSSATKAVTGEMPATYDTGESFVAFAGWTENTYSGASAVREFFVNNLTTAICSYDATLNSWKPVTTYYWPKTGYLTFEAFSPADARYHTTVSHTWGTGFTFTNFQIRGGIKDQYDLLYSNRELNKRRAEYTVTDGSAYDDENDATYTYNGVNLLFNHALSSIVFKVKTKADYSTNATIKIQKITIDNAAYKGTFNENVTDGTTFFSAPAWTVDDSEEVQYDILGAEQEVVSGTAQSLAPLKGGATNIILLPQDLRHSGTTNDVNVSINYTIAQNGSAPIPQTATISLYNLKAGTENITAWQMGKRYTYTIVFGLDEIYFDPSVTAWADVAMDDIEL